MFMTTAFVVRRLGPLDAAFSAAQTPHHRQFRALVGFPVRDAN
jgi:hypothetical protein